VWASSRALKRNRNDDDLDNINPDINLSICALCGSAIDSEKKFAVHVHYQYTQVV
jgi:hypothetical protein